MFPRLSVVLPLLVVAPVAAELDCSAPPLDEPSAAYVAKVDALHRQLGIPSEYTEEFDLTLQPEAATLKLIAVDPGQGAFLMSPDAAEAWLQMQAAARMDGVELLPLSTFRSVFRQADILRGRLEDGESLEEVLKTSVAPGYSEHHTGDAVDIDTPGATAFSEEFAETSAFAWLEENAEAFCFELSYPEDNNHGIAFEPWHWRYQRSGTET